MGMWRMWRLRLSRPSRTGRCIPYLPELGMRSFLDALPGHLLADAASQSRIRIVLQRMENLALGVRRKAGSLQRARDEADIPDPPLAKEEVYHCKHSPAAIPQP